LTDWRRRRRDKNGPEVNNGCRGGAKTVSSLHSELMMHGGLDPEQRKEKENGFVLPRREENSGLARLQLGDENRGPAWAGGGNRGGEKRNIYLLSGKES